MRPAKKKKKKVLRLNTGGTVELAADYFPQARMTHALGSGLTILNNGWDTLARLCCGRYCLGTIRTTIPLVRGPA